MLGWLMTSSVVLMNTASFNFIVIMSSSLWMNSASSHFILRPSFKECSSV
jgi:hypothetical protein